jgi:predicted permease
MLNDLRYALRSLSRNPVFTIGAIVTLALGIGVNSTIFTLSNAVLFRPMPGIAAPSELTWISSVGRDRRREVGMSYPDYLDYRAASAAAFVDLLAFRPTPVSLGSGGDPERIRGHLVTGTYFGLLGVHPSAGRLIGPTDDRTSVADPIVVISDRLWRRRFNADPQILNRPIVINGRSFVVVGVAAAGFVGPELGEAAEVWIPLSVLPLISASDATLLEQRGSSWLRVMGRLKPGVAAAAAQQALAPVAARLEQAYPESNTNRLVAVSSAGSALSPGGRAEAAPLAALLMVVTALVLLIACANVANLLLARGARRALEISVRSALGATRGRLIRQLLTESLVLATAAASGGLLLSFWASDLLLTALPPQEFEGFHGTADLRVLLFTVLTAAISICVFGLAPALRATRRAAIPSLRDTPSAGGRSRLQGAFVIVQLSLSLVLLLGAGLSLRAVQHAARLDLGFNPSQLLTASYDLVLQNYPAERREPFRRELLSRIEALPGVTSATLTNMTPLGGTMVSTVVSSPEPGREAAESRAFLNAVGSRYFATLELPIVRGRGIEPADRRGAAGAAVVNETLARRLWPDGEALGRPIRLGDDALTVVGIAQDSKYDEATEDPQPFLYLSLAQHPQLDRETLLVRVSGVPGANAAPVQAVIRALDPALPVFDIHPFERVLEDRADKQRGISRLLAGFGVLALALASLGLYGVMAYTVTLRRREMGVRMALGASPAQLTRLIAGDGLRLALIGTAIGSVLALPVAHALDVLVFGVRIGDVAAFAATCALLIAVAVLAAVLPARRAARLDPMLALRLD